LLMMRTRIRAGQVSEPDAPGRCGGSCRDAQERCSANIWRPRQQQESACDSNPPPQCRAFLNVARPRSRLGMGLRFRLHIICRRSLCRFPSLPCGDRSEAALAVQFAVLIPFSRIDPLGMLRVVVQLASQYRRWLKLRPET
jgi:hypothetical protein